MRGPRWVAVLERVPCSTGPVVFQLVSHDLTGSVQTVLSVRLHCVQAFAVFNPSAIDRDAKRVA